MTNLTPKLYVRTDPFDLIEFLINKWGAEFPSIELPVTYPSSFHAMIDDIARSDAFDHPLSPSHYEAPYWDDIEMEDVSLGKLFIHGAIIALSVQNRGYVEPDFLISLLLELLGLKPQFHIERRHDRVRFTTRQP